MAGTISEIGATKNAGEHKKATKHLLDCGEVALEALHGREERADGDSGDDKGNAEAERIDEEQAHSLADRVFARGDGEDRAKHRADARRPAEGKGEPDDIGTDEACRARVGMIARLAMEDRKMDHAKEM